MGEKKIFNRLAENEPMSEEEKNRFIDKLLQQQQDLNEKFELDKADRDARLRAKLEARKRIRDAKEREDAQRKELDTVSKNMNAMVYSEGTVEDGQRNEVTLNEEQAKAEEQLLQEQEERQAKLLLEQHE